MSVRVPPKTRIHFPEGGTSMSFPIKQTVAGTALAIVLSSTAFAQAPSITNILQNLSTALQNFAVEPGLNPYQQSAGNISSSPFEFSQVPSKTRRVIRTVNCIISIIPNGVIRNVTLTVNNNTFYHIPVSIQGTDSLASVFEGNIETLAYVEAGFSPNIQVNASFSEALRGISCTLSGYDVRLP